MNADLILTIGFCLIVLFVSLAEGVLVAVSVRKDKRERSRRRTVNESGRG